MFAHLALSFHSWERPVGASWFGMASTTRIFDKNLIVLFAKGVSLKIPTFAALLFLLSYDNFISVPHID